MGDKTKIEWTDATWNPIRGCSKVSTGCKNCYAETMAARFCGGGKPYEGLIRNGRWNGQIRLVTSKLSAPLRWQKPRKIFVNSMSDLFHENVPFEYVAAVFGVMGAAEKHTFQVLTKRPERALEFFAWLGWQDGEPYPYCESEAIGQGVSMNRFEASTLDPPAWPPPNVWLGVSVENQETANERIPVLLECTAAVRFLSCEPLLGPIDLGLSIQLAEADEVIDWVIVGGESGPGARPMDMQWALELMMDCEHFGISFLFKQWGAHNSSGERVGKKNSGRILDGRTWDEFPEEEE